MICYYGENVTLSVNTRPPHFWQTDKARFLEEQRRCWADCRQTFPYQTMEELPNERTLKVRGSRPYSELEDTG
jgi:hypothetical protein